jgi:hypothetical protein
MKSSTTKTLLAATLLVALAATVVLPASAAMTTEAATPTQLRDFEQMLPTVWVSWKWMNESNVDWPLPFNTSVQVTQPYLVSDARGVQYLILEQGNCSWQSSWTYKSLQVLLIHDPDGSFISWLQSHDAHNQTAVENPRRSALTGDEVFVYAHLYEFVHHISYTYDFHYSWFNVTGGNTTVASNLVAPLLKPRFSWALPMNGTVTGQGTRDDCKLGFDLTEFFLSKEPTVIPLIMRNTLQPQWAQHEFAGLTVFNDTNHNGIIDLVSQKESFYAPTTAPNLEFQLLNSTQSELAYHFEANDATLGEVAVPHVNANDEIEWSMEFRNIAGELVPLDVLFASPQLLLIYIPRSEHTGIPTTLESLQFVCRFGLKADRAVLKVDQHIGRFLVPHNETILPEAKGLSLALSYWSGFSEPSLVAAGEAGGIDFDHLNASRILSGGGLHFDEQTEHLADVQFGGNYTWSKTGATYPVGTMITPIFGIHLAPKYVVVPRLLGYFNPLIWVVRRYCYTSCYAHWDGYAITHDPIYTVFPAIPPVPLNGTWALVPAIVISIIAIVAISVVMVRIRGVRKASSPSTA